VTHRANLDLIRTSRALRPAEQLTTVPIEDIRRDRQIRSGLPVLRDQNLLHEKCIEFPPGFSFADLLNDLNRRVFFWSGWPDRPIKPGRHAINHYRASDVVIRVPFREVAMDHTPYFSCCNSGAMRMQRGRRVPRGPRTFLQARQCDFSPTKVVEVTFVQPVNLPRRCEVSYSLGGPWEIL
jgi:hypothetical protein